MMESAFTTASQAMVAATATTFTALLLARALWHKLSERAAFTGFLADYRLLPERAVEPAAWLLAAMEGAAIALLVWPAARPAGAVLAAGLLALYGAAMAINIARGRAKVECGCGGPAQALSVPLLARNGVLALIALAAGVNGPGAGLGLPEASVSILAGLTLWLLYAGIEQLLANAGQMRLAGTPRGAGQPPSKN
ncbi:MauE/DoxX family redox-associated membrane protein [Xanthobacter sediminis]|uniref:MauE/DoxX family redox-associated membrane protein n=1 Tax=Xanthobacter sediminis TaxID=3119926 RepID=UPI00372A74A4